MQLNPFASEARAYAHLRPTYPEPLFDFLATVPQRTEVAWDCGTGNGQAATRLVQRFRRVVATDESPEMIAQAIPGDRVHYWAAEAEQSGIADSVVDLVTVAAAVHWFDLEAFYAEVRRVTRPGAALAVWTYYFEPKLGDPLGEVVHRLAHETLQDYWDQRVHYVVEAFADLPFPFDEVPAPAFETQMHWTLPEFEGYVETWSASRAFLRQHGARVTAEFAGELAAAWGDPALPRDLHFPLALRVGRVA